MSFPSTKAFARNQSGQALVETALLAGTLVLVLAGVIDFGRFTYAGVLVGNGARSGAEYGALSQTNADDFAGMAAAATADMNGLAGASATATNYCQCSDGSSYASPCSTTALACTGSTYAQARVQVTTTGKFSPWFAFPGIAASLTITRVAVQQVAP